MTKYKDEYINKLKQDFRSKGYKEVEAKVGDYSFSYFILPKTLKPELQNFALVLPGETKDNYLIGVSEDIREEFQKYFAAHEYIEFVKFYDVQGKCVKALEEELKQVPKEIKKDYLKARMDFFKNLIDYVSKYSQDYGKETANEFKQSLSKLEELVEAEKWQKKNHLKNMQEKFLD